MESRPPTYKERLMAFSRAEQSKTVYPCDIWTGPSITRALIGQPDSIKTLHWRETDRERERDVTMNKSSTDTHRNTDARVVY